MSLLALEDALIAATAAALGSAVRAVESLPGDWDDEMLNRLLRAAPGALVSFLGGQRLTTGGDSEARIEARWAVYLVTNHASGEAARRRGDAMQPGCYELIVRLVPALHGRALAPGATLSLLDVQNLYTGSVERKGLTVYALQFSHPMTFALGAPDGLDDFLRLHTAWDVPPHTPARHPQWLVGDDTNAAPDARDRVALPAA